MVATSWATRIPAAIAKGKWHLGPIWAPGDDGAAIDSLFFKDGQALTAGEVALAEALWELHKFAEMKLYGGSGPATPPALIAFTERIERLSND